jgi:peptidyl-prolyl cis-trans isomerase SurA
MSLKEGQVSRVIKSKFGYHIIQCITRSGEDVTVRHILKVPRINEPDIQKSITKLDSVRAQLIAGSISFGEAVSKYSDEEQSKFTGGRKTAPDGSSQITIDQLDKDIVVMLDKMQPGEYTEPRSFTDERGKKGVRILYLMSRTEPHRENLKDDYNKFAGRALEAKKENHLESWFRKNAATFYVNIEEDFKRCESLQELIGF